jgi:hypothetical protein
LSIVRALANDGLALGEARFASSARPAARHRVAVGLTR